MPRTQFIRVFFIALARASESSNGFIYVSIGPLSRRQGTPRVLTHSRDSQREGTGRLRK